MDEDVIEFHFNKTEITKLIERVARETLVEYAKSQKRSGTPEPSNEAVGRIERIKQRRFRRIFIVKKVGNTIEMPPDISEYMYGFDDIVIERRL